jgi:putative pyruvate formate lyase activating enzyme
MICAEPKLVFSVLQTRPALARERARRARALLADCRLCAHDCGVNRLADETGLCHAGAEARFFSAQVEVSDELELMPTFSVALSGCDLRCNFCITGTSSWNARAGLGFDAAAMAVRAETALRNGARTIMVLGGEPTIHLPSALEFVSLLPESAKLIWKTNAHGTAQARELLDGMFDVWLADFKFGSDACAQRLAKVPDYVRVVQENLLWFADVERRSPTRHVAKVVEQSHAGSETGAPRQSELIVRHLLMPGHVECCWRPVAEWLAENLPGVKVNLRSGFWPAWKSARHLELRGTVADDEARCAWQIAETHGLNLIP